MVGILPVKVMSTNAVFTAMKKWSSPQIANRTKIVPFGTIKFFPPTVQLVN